MKLTDGLLGEHALFYSLFARADALLSEPGSLEQLTATASLLRDAVVSHASLEETLLFAALAERGLSGGPLNVMRAEHEEIEAIATELPASKTADDARRGLRQLLSILREHFQREEKLLFPMSEKILGAEKLTELGARWALARGLP